MDEDLAIINSNTRTEKFKNFFVDNKKKISNNFINFYFIIV